jgi:hypothetical protein
MSNMTEENKAKRFNAKDYLDEISQINAELKKVK